LGIALIDSLTGHVLDVNPKFAKIEGRTMEEMSNIDWMSITHPDDIQEDLDNMVMLNAGKIQGFQMEKRYLQHDSSSVWINMTIAPIYGEDHTQPRHLCMIEDITDRKLTVEVLKKSEEKLRQLNLDKDRFLSILGHDLRSPFNALLGLSELLKENIQEFQIDEIKNMAGDINKTAQNTFNLLEDILTWARAQQGKIPFKPQNLSFADICRGAFEVLKPNADVKNITLHYSTVDHVSVFADADMLKTVLRNLVSNAIKFTNNGGAININAVENPGNITISVSDNGIGIEPDDMTKLFNISEVITTKGTAKETGTGLGLLLCKEFVEKHGGKIRIESEVEKGTTFYFGIDKAS
jgi:PAS domain S-box-containing protein